MKTAYSPQIQAKSHVGQAELTAPAFLAFFPSPSTSATHQLSSSLGWWDTRKHFLLVYLPQLQLSPRETRGMVLAPPRTLPAQWGNATRTFPRDVPKCFGGRGCEDREEPF